MSNFEVQWEISKKYNIEGCIEYFEKISDNRYFAEDSMGNQFEFIIDNDEIIVL